jgi:CRP/FNR family transcriptional regulator, cyclic AMP receptor protein
MNELARISLFEKLDESELSRLATICKRRVFPPDTVVFFEGDQSDSLYVILSGATKVYTTDDDGKEKVLNTLGAGEIFGEYSLIDGHPRSAAVSTLERTEVLCLSHVDFRKFCKGAPDILWKVLESLTGRMRRQTNEMMELSFRDVPHRLLRVLVNLAEKHGKQTPDGVAIQLAISAATLAGMAGSSPERVSRLMHRFQGEGLVRNTDADHILVPDLDALKRALEYAQDWS